MYATLNGSISDNERGSYKLLVHRITVRKEELIYLYLCEHLKSEICCCTSILLKIKVKKKKENP